MECSTVVIILIIIALVVIIISQTYNTECRKDKKCDFSHNFAKSYSFLLLIIVLFCPCSTWMVLLLLALVVVLSFVSEFVYCCNKPEKKYDYMIDDD